MNMFLDLFNVGLITIPKKDLIFVSIKGLHNDPSMWKKIYGNIVHTNMVPLLALFIATPKLPATKRLFYCGISLLALLITHFIHLYLDIFMLYPHTVHISTIPFVYSIKCFLLVKFMPGLHVLWEQILRMILPFLLWVGFAFSHLVSLVKE